MTEAEWLSCQDPRRVLKWLSGTGHERKLRLFACACARPLLPPLEEGEEAGPLAPEAIEEYLGAGDLGPVVAKAGRWAVEVSEAFADGAGTAEELEAAFNVIPIGNQFADYACDGEYSSEEEIIEVAAAELACVTADAQAWSAAASAWPIVVELAAQRAYFRAENAEAGARAYNAARAKGAAHEAAWGAGDEARHGPAEAAREDARATANAEVCQLLREIFGNPFRPAPAIDPAWLSSNGGLVRRLARTAYDEHRFEGLPVLADALEEAGCADAAILSHLRGPDPHARGCWTLDLLLGKS
jgi:hypothetical protein